MPCAAACRISCSAWRACSSSSTRNRAGANCRCRTEPRRRELPLPDGDPDEAGDEAEAPCDAPGPLARVLADEAAEEVRHALARLAPHYRDVLILYELHDLSYLEIAAICQVDIGTVRSRLSRGRAALAKHLRAHAGAA